MSSRHKIEVTNGVVLVGSDAHIWPGCGMSTAIRGLVKFIHELHPKAVIMNGDMMDFPQISRHPPIGHQKLPDVWEEIQAAQMVLRKIEKAVKRGTDLVWPLGNHDARFETKLATIAAEFSKLPGHMLRNYFPEWEPCWSCWINDDVVVKHRVNGGVHATHNNIIKTGMHTITGHLHSAKVTGYTNLRGTLWGVDAGCMADVYAEPFTDYLEDGPRNWRSGFCVLTFKNGELLQPELALVWDENHIQFRGQIIKV